MSESSPAVLTVRAKFRCASVEKPVEGDWITYRFEAAIEGDENKSWAKYTPSGQLVITINQPTAQIFERDEFYFLDFTPAA